MRTEMTLSMLREQLTLNCGDMLGACKAAGVSVMFVDRWRKDDKEVDEALAEAERVGTQGLVSAAIERAVKGVKEDVYYKGIVVGEKTNYSDSLLTTLLKAKVPEFHKDSEGGGVQVNVNVANVMPRANSYEEWLLMKRATEAPALPAPLEQIEDATFKEVPPFEGLGI
jgi:hypothetical protein